MMPIPRVLVAIALVAGVFILRIAVLAREAPFVNAEPMHSVAVIMQDGRQLVQSRDTLTSSERDSIATVLNRSGWQTSPEQFDAGNLTVRLYGKSKPLGMIYIANNAIVAVDNSGKEPIKRSLTFQEREFLARTLRR